MKFIKHTTETAPEKSKELLKKVLNKFGFIPNQDKILAISPSIYQAYNQSFDLFLGKSSLGLLEGQIVIMTASYENNSPYCMAVHTWGMEMTKVPKDVIESLRNGNPIADSRLEMLRDFTKKLMMNKGHLDEKILSAFFDTGFTQENVIEIIGGISAKTISNYVNVIAKTEVDEIMEKYKWEK
ncbi:carboxymuconolactone decarboxylase [Tenacibaculum sp. Bg11-29]|uniref:carboxymuconolactone decarboxylase family protein n=1 Tax=Tenacibaculum sp. Bg11-29 TaxID=2058306 RepID=UPI000C33D4EA|nr:carboxymuconolactone decarboxylase family protein [Tenacibaculum sp. Bg11-29]PKH51353.1 carboxymuconolactone decarboxylase [Tenacibaculum sp. Bg11-29]